LVDFLSPSFPFSPVMPELDGYEATRQMRRSEDEKIRCLPIVACTASAVKGEKEKAMLIGMDDYLTKPVRPQVLEKMLDTWLFDEKTRISLERHHEIRNGEFQE